MDLSSVGKVPVQADRPAGSDVRYDPQFEELQSEVDKLSSPVASGPLDWSKVVLLSSDILARKSKDLLVAGYLAVALIYTRKLEGFAIGLRVILDLLERYWDDLYPSKARMRGRLGAVTWWLEKSETALAQIPPTPLPAEEVAPVQECLEKIGGHIAHYFEEPPSLQPLFAFLESSAVSRQGEAEAAAAPRAQAPSTSAGLPPAETKTPQKAVLPEASADIASSEDAQKAITFSLRKMREAAGYLRKEDPSNPRSYRVTRWIAWSGLDALPPAVDGRTRIPPPATHIKAPLDDVRSKGNHEALLQEVETILPQFIFWLDLNRWAAEALSLLGEKYHGAREAVCQETAFLCHRIPALEELAFSDGTPFADPETRQWLDGIAFGAGGTEGGESRRKNPGMTDPERDEIAEEVGKAKALIRDGRLADAIAPIQQRLRSGFSRKDTLLWRMELSRLLLGAKQARLALPHLEQIQKEIDDFRLEEYDPMFALEGLKLLWRGYDAQTDKSSKERAAQALLRIGKIDLTEVLRMGKGK